MSDIRIDFVNTLIEFLECSKKYPKQSFHLDYEMGVYRQTKLVQFIKRDIIGFCLTDKEYQQYMHNPTQQDYLKKAWRRISTAPAKNKGDFGEFLLYAILKYYYNLEHRIAKVKIKTARGDQVKGFDCAHFKVDNNKLTLILGEAKLYQDFDEALRSVATSIKNLVAVKKINDEISMLADHLEDQSYNSEYAEARRILTSGISTDQVKFKIPVLLTYNSQAVKEHTSSNSPFPKNLEIEINRHFQSINNKSFSLLSNFKIEFFVLPFESVVNFRDEIEKIREANS